jgi:hypothetical protein
MTSPTMRANTGSVPETRADQSPVSIVESSDDWLQLHEISTLLIQPCITASSTLLSP